MDAPHSNDAQKMGCAPSGIYIYIYSTSEAPPRAMLYDSQSITHHCRRNAVSPISALARRLAAVASPPWALVIALTANVYISYEHISAG